MDDAILASHILLAYQGAAKSTARRTKEEAAAEIAKLKQELEAGADFEQLARTHSDCTSSSRGGDLGLFSRGEMVPAFDDVAFALDVDELSDVVETKFGFHLIFRMG